MTRFARLTSGLGVPTYKQVGIRSHSSRGVPSTKDREQGLETEIWGEISESARRAIWKKRVAILLIGPMLVMSGAIVALGAHIEAPLLITTATSPQTVQPGGSATFAFILDNQGSASRFEFLVTNTNTPDFSYELTDAAGVPLTDTDADGTVDVSQNAHGTQEFRLVVTADPNAAFLSTTTTSIRSQRKGGSFSNVLSFVTQVGEGGPVSLDKSSNDPDALVLVGQTVTYSIAFTNPYSTQTVTVFEITDTLDADVTIDPASISGLGVYDPVSHHIVWSLGDLSPSQSGSVSYTATVEVIPDAMTIVNTAVGDGSNVAPASDSVTLTVTAPVLLIDKTVSDASPSPGQEITFTIGWDVQGSTPLSNFVVTDTYDPSGVSVSAISPAPASHDPVGGVIVWNLGTVANGSTGTVVVTGTVIGTAQQTVVNTAQGDGDQIPPVSDSATFTVLSQADLSIAKMDLTDPVSAGALLTYSITVTNSGANPAEDVTVIDDLPPGVTFTAAAGATCSATAEGFQCSLGQMATTTSLSFSVDVMVDPGIPTGTILSNTVTVTSLTDDPNLLNNTDTETTSVIEESNLVVSKTDGLAQVSAGTGPHTYTITIHSQGPSNAPVTLVDLWPSSFVRTSLSCSPSAGLPTGTGGFTCPLGVLGPNSTVTVTASYVVPPGTPPGTYLNTATATPVSSETQTSDNTAADDTTVVQEFDLAVSKTDGPVAPDSGDAVAYMYTIMVFNPGPSDAPSVLLTDDWPDGFQRTGLSCVPVVGSATGTGDFTCNLGTIASGTTATLTAGYIVPSSTRAGPQTNTVTALAAGETDPSDNTAVDVTVVGEATDLVVSKDDGVTTLVAGDGAVTTFTISVFNAGPSDAFSVLLSDTWPPGYQRLGNSVTCDNPTGTGDFTCSVGTIAAGTTATVTATYTVPSDTKAGPVTNTVNATSSTETDPLDNTATDATVVIEESDLVVSKSDGVGAVIAGTGPYTYTITVQNAGPSDAYSVTLVDDWPAEFVRTSVSCTLLSGSATGTGDFTCSLGTIPAGTAATVTATYTVPSSVTSTAVTNTATGFSTTDVDLTNNVAFDTNSIGLANDLVVAKSDGVGAVIAGTGPYTYTITVQNAGPSDAYSVTLVDDWPAEFVRTSVSCTLLSGSATGTGDFTCALGTIPAGATATMTATYTVPSSVSARTVTNTATATVSSETNPLDNTASDSTTVVEATDLVVSKADGVTTLVAGDGAVTTFTIAVFNAGPSDAFSVSLSDTWPSGYLRLGNSATCDNPTGTGDFTCSLGTIAAGTTATVTASYTVPSDTPAGSYTNTATASSPTETDPTDNTDTDVNAVTTRADLVVTKSDDPDPVPVLTGIAYTVTVTNLGPSDADQVVLIDNLDDRTTYVTHTASNLCAIDAGLDLITCDVGSIPSGSNFTFEIRVALGILPNATILSNRASVTSLTSDPVAANDVVTETTTVIAPVMRLTKSASPPSGTDVSPGEEIVYTITYRNQGNLAGTNLVITDTVSDAFGSPVVNNGGVYDPVSRTITWTVTSVAPGESGTVSFSVQLGSTDRQRFVDNVATATVTEMLQTISSNSTRHTLISPDVSINKSADIAENSEVRALQVITYTLTIRNRSNVDAFSVSVRDDPPAGTNYVPGSTRIDGSPVGDSGGSSPLFSGVNLGTLRRGETRTASLQLQVRGDVVPGQIIENWGFVTWNLGTQQSGDFHHLRVISRISPPTLRMSILVQQASGETIFVTIFNRVIGLLVVTGYEALLLLLLALGALGAGRNLAGKSSPDLLRRMLR